MVQNKEEAGTACYELAYCAEQLIGQLNALDGQPTRLEAYVKGLLARVGSTMKDASLLFKNNTDRHLSGAFILFRVAMDDLLRLSYVYSQPDKEEAMTNFTADAWRQWYLTWDTAADLSLKVYGQPVTGLPTKDLVEQQRSEFLADPSRSQYVRSNRSGGVSFKDKPQTPEMVDAIVQCKRVREYARAYVLFKHWSHYVHYSMFTYELDHDGELRKLELQWIDEPLYLTYQCLRLSQEMIALAQPVITWPTSTRLDGLYNRPSYIVAVQ